MSGVEGDRKLLADCKGDAIDQFLERTMPTLEFLRAEIERMRVQVSRQRKEILQLQRAGIGTASAEALPGCRRRSMTSVPSGMR